MEARAPQPSDLPGESLEGVVARLQGDFPSVETRRICEVVELVHDGYREARIRTFVAIFVERESRLRLRGDLIHASRESSQQSAEVAGPARALLG